MKFGDYPLAECEGAILAHGVAGLSKGDRLDHDAIAAARAAGLETLPVAIPEAGDILEAEAAMRIARALAGPAIRAEAPVHGRVDLVAEKHGLLTFDADAVGKLNAQTEAVGVATRAPLDPVRAGTTVATLKIVPFAMAGELVDKAETAGRTARLAIAPFEPLRGLLIQTRHAATPEKMLAKTARVSRTRIEDLGGTMTEAEQPEHAVQTLAEALGSSAAANADLVLVAGASATSDRRDVIPQAILAAGGRIERLGMPVDPGNLLLLGSLREKPVIGLPGCARSPKRNGFDMVLERLFAGMPVTSADIAAMGAGGLIAPGARPDG